MSLKIIISSVCKSLNFSPTKWVLIFKISGTTRIMRKSFFWNFHKSYVLFLKSKGCRKIIIRYIIPFFKKLLICSWLTKEFHLHLFEFSGTKYKILWSNFITKRFSYLSNSKGYFFSACSSNVCEIHKHPLSGLRT